MLKYNILQHKISIFCINLTFFFVNHTITSLSGQYYPEYLQVLSSDVAIKFSRELDGFLPIKQLFPLRGNLKFSREFSNMIVSGKMQKLYFLSVRCL